MKLGYFHNGHFPPIDFEDFVRWGSEHGYHAIDVPLFQPDAARVCGRYDLEPTSTTGAAFQPIARESSARRAEVAKGTAAVDYAAAEGIPTVLIGHRMAPQLAFDENVRLFSEGCAPVAAHAERKSVRLVLENWAADGQNLAYAPARWEAIFDALPGAAVGLCFDPSHLVWLRIDYLRAVREFGDRIYHAHAKDTELLPAGLYRHGVLGSERDRLGRGTYRFRIPGFGVVDWPAYVTALVEAGYEGPLTVEHEDALWSSSTDSDHALKGLVLAERFLAPLLV